MRILIFLLFSSFSYAGVEEIFDQPDQQIVIATKKFEFDRFPGAFNPSIIKMDTGFLLTFRYCPDLSNQPWLSYIGIVVLDPSLNPTTSPKLLSTRAKQSKTPSQTEDARFFTYRNKLFLLYNDNLDEIYFDTGRRRDMFMAELTSSDGHFQLSSPLKLVFEEKYQSQWQQKNWIPFEWHNELYFSYSIHPHEVLSPNFKTGICHALYKTTAPIQWPYGPLRGSSYAQLVDGEYLAFFHSGIKIKSSASHNWKLWHYFMGAFTFSPDPPFAITKMTPQPIISEDFYTPSYREKRVVFPGGFAIDGPYIYVAYGKDDCEIWVATLDKEALRKALKPQRGLGIQPY